MKFVVILILFFAFIYGMIGLYAHLETQRKSSEEKIEEKKLREIPVEPEKRLDEKAYYYRTYEFLDDKNQTYRIKHAILKKIVKDSEERFGVSEEKLIKILNEKARDFNEKYTGKINVTITKKFGYKAKYKSGFAHLNSKFRRVYNDILKKYYKDHMINFKSGIPDYKTIQRWQAPYVKRLYNKIHFLAKRNKMNEREFIILMARFVQYLRYKIPPKLNHKENYGFWPPIICLKEQAGDCDSKSTLFATIFCHYKNNSCILILTKRHAFIGIKNQHRLFPTDFALKIGGIDYLFLETTYRHQIGYINKKYLNQIKKRHFKYITYH